jgi:P22 coat protein - gene protein 5
MANDLSVLAPKLLAQGLMALRENAVMPRLVNRDYETEAAQKGTTVTIPIPSAIADRNVAPNVVPPASVDSTPTQALVPLDQWREAPFHLTDKEQRESLANVIPMQASEAIKSLVNTANAFIMNKYKGVYGVFGVAGTTPFASTTAEATGTRKVLNNQLAPLDNRRMVIDPDAEAEALNLRAFQDMSFSGSAEGIVEGKINRKLGFDWFMDQQVPTHTAGSITVAAAVTVTTVEPIGETVINMTTGAGDAINLLEGDIIVFSNHAQTYVLTADATVGASTTGDINIAPGLQVATAGGETLTLTATHVVNLGFHRDAFAFASRPLADQQGLGNIIESATDPVSGLSLRLEISRQHKQVQFSYDMLYGAALVRRELAARMLG